MAQKISFISGLKLVLENTMPDNEGKILLYQTDDGKVTVDVRFEYETF